MIPSTMAAPNRMTSAPVCRQTRDRLALAQGQRPEPGSNRLDLLQGKDRLSDLLPVKTGQAQFNGGEH